MSSFEEEKVDFLVRHKAETRGYSLIEENGRVCWMDQTRGVYFFRVDYPSPKVVLYMELPDLPVEQLSPFLDSLFSTRVRY